MNKRMVRLSLLAFAGGIGAAIGVWYGLRFLWLSYAHAGFL